MALTSDTLTAFDIEAAINAFAKDVAQPTLKLPRALTPEQRKLAKKLVEQHSELKCDSFGFGPERQLHLFKKSSSRSRRSTKQPVADPFLCRSLPSQLSAGETQKSSADIVTIEESATQPHNSSEMETVTPETVTPDSSPREPDDILEQPDDWELSGEEASGKEDAMDGSGKPPGLRSPDAASLPLRNTFIDMGAAAEEGGRQVQTMPHGMFGGCIFQEAAAANPPAETSCAPPSEPAVKPEIKDVVPSPPSHIADVLTLGSEVVIDGLVKCPAFNGQLGSVESFDMETGRFNVLLALPAMGQRWAKIKRENLTMVAPPPPAPPTLHPCLLPSYEPWIPNFEPGPVFTWTFDDMALSADQVA